MDFFSFIEVVVQQEKNLTSVRAVLQQGMRHGFIYFPKPSGLAFDMQHAFSLEQALQYVQNCVECVREANSTLSSQIYVCHNDRYFSLWFGTIFNHLHLSLFPDDNTKYKEPTFLDIEYYLVLLMNACSDYEIISVETHDEEQMTFYHQDANLYPEFQPQEHTQPRQQRVDVTLLVNDKISDVRKMVEKSQARGIRFFAQSKKLPLQELSVDATIDLLLNSSMVQGFPELIHRTDYPVLCKIADQWYALVIGVRSTARAFSLIRVHLPEPSAPAASFNTAMYHALDLCKDFCIIELVTFDTWYNSYKLLPQYQP